MSVPTDLPFPIGSTGGYTSASDGVQWEGREFIVEDLDYSSSPAKPRAYASGGQTNEHKVIRCVRNVSGVALLPGYLCQFGTATGQYGYRVTGYSNVNPQEAYVVDEFLPAAGVANNDLFYIVIEGKTNVRVSCVAANAVISAGSAIVADTAAASTFSTTAGRVTAQTIGGATAPLANQIMFRLGIMLTGVTTANTDSYALAQIYRGVGVG